MDAFRIKPALVLSEPADNVMMTQPSVVESASAGINPASYNNASACKNVAELKIYECLGRKPISLATVAGLF